MSDFCSQCSPFKDEYDIDLFKIAIRLKRGHSKDFVCEGCSNRAIYKDEDGRIYLIRYEENDYKNFLINIEDLI